MLTGWEDEVPAEDTLLRRFLLANVARFETMCLSAGTSFRTIDGAVLADLRSEVVFDNVLLLTRPPVDGVHPLIEEGRSFFARERPWLLMSFWPIPDLASTGLELMGHPPIMFRAAGAPPNSALRSIEGFEIIEIAPGDAKGARSFVDTLSRAYPMLSSGQSVWGLPDLGDPDLRRFLGLLDGRPVATSASYIHGGINDIEAVSCIEEHRGRGIGEAISWAATRADPDLPAVLLASDDGQPVYERMGYLRLLRMTLWFSTGTAG
jgi:hypothetical protein